MPLTKSNYELPKRKKVKYTKKTKEKMDRYQYEEKNIATRGAKGSFMVFREDGLEDLFLVDEL